MSEYIQYESVNLDINPIKTHEEKRKLKKTCNLIGAAFIVLWILPSIINTIIRDVAKITGSTNAVQNAFNDPAVFMVLQTVYSIILFTLPFLILPIGLGKKVSDFAFINRPKKGLLIPFILIGIGTSALANLITNNLVATFEQFKIHFESPNITYPEGIFGFALSFIAIAITPALVEEFATRGMVMGASREFGEGFGIAVSAIFFSLMHGNLVQIPFALIMGVVIAFAVVKTGSLITGIIIHFINNAFSVIMTYTLAGVESTIIQSVFSILYLNLCALCMFLGILFMTKRTEKPFKLSNADSQLSFGQKLRIFIFSPTVIVAIGLTVYDCIGMISFG